MLRLLTAALVLIGLCLSAQAQSQDWDKVVADGKKEGKVVIYNSANGAAYFTNIVKSFEQKYGITVDSLDLRASELTERIRAEQVAGRFLGDLELHSTSTIEQQIIDGPYVEPIGRVPNIANLRPDLPATDMYIPAWIQAYGVLINTRLVNQRTSRKRGPICSIRNGKEKFCPTTRGRSAAGRRCSSCWRRPIGTPFHEKLAAQELVFSRDLRNDARRVARGEYPIYIPQMFAMASDIKGLAGQGAGDEGGRALRADQFRAAEEFAASECRASVHQPFPRDRTRRCNMPMRG